MKRPHDFRRWRRLVRDLKRATLGLALVASLGAPAYADENAKAENQLLLVQSLDAITTRINVARGCSELDPLLRGPSRSDLGMLAETLVTNGIARLLFRRAPGVLRILTIGDLAAVANNAVRIARGPCR